VKTNSEESKQVTANLVGANSPQAASVEGSSEQLGAVATGSVALFAAVKAWRKAERKHASIVLGLREGDLATTKDDADKKLHAVRIEADKCEAPQNIPVSNAHTNTGKLSDHE
jgi:hypothetical protein